MAIVKAVAVDLQKRAPLLDVLSLMRAEPVGAMDVTDGSGGRVMAERPGQTEPGGEAGIGVGTFARE